MLERFLDADIRDIDDITGWMADDFGAQNDDFMRDVSSMMDDDSRFE